MDALTNVLRRVYRCVTQNLKFAYQWITRILLAPNHFGVGLLDRLHWALCGGYVVDQVALYRLNEGTRDQYLSEFDWYRSRPINKPYDTMLNNKVICAQMVAPYASTPEVLYFTQKGRIACPGRPDHWASVDEVLRAIAEQGDMFTKPIASGKGNGVHLIGPDGRGSYLIDREPASRERVAELLGGDDWLLCPAVRQSAFLNGIFADASNTIRAITLRDPGTGRYRMFFAVLRIGTASTVPVDNGSKGGLVAKIDLATGELSEARSIQADVHLARHPDTGAVIEGAVIPRWAEVRDSVVALAERFPFLEFVAWDILLTDEGFSVIEANASTGVNIIQIWGGQRSGELGDFYRAHGVIK